MRTSASEQGRRRWSSHSKIRTNLLEIDLIIIRINLLEIDLVKIRSVPRRLVRIQLGLMCHRLLPCALDTGAEVTNYNC